MDTLTDAYFICFVVDADDDMSDDTLIDSLKAHYGAAARAAARSTGASAGGCGPASDDCCGPASTDDSGVFGAGHYTAAQLDQLPAERAEGALEVAEDHQLDRSPRSAATGAPREIDPLRIAGPEALEQPRGELVVGLCGAHVVRRPLIHHAQVREVAVVDLARATGEASYTRLAASLIDMRDLIADGTITTGSRDRARAALAGSRMARSMRRSTRCCCHGYAGPGNVVG
jgi:hypothetical protein